MQREVDPFAGIEDEPALTADELRASLLADARRGFVPIRKVFVQLPKTSPMRASLLAKLVTGRHERALDAFLLLHALNPVLPGSPLPLSTWAALLSGSAPCSTPMVTKAFRVLADLKLVSRRDETRRPVLEPLLEDGSGSAWTRPGVDDEGPGFFTLPHEYWTAGYSGELTLPGKAMLLIMLAETQDPRHPSMSMAVERAHDWYGISERTAERGYGQLRRAGLLLVKIQKVADARHPAQRREVYHRALASPFSTNDRARLQRVARKAVRGRDAAMVAVSMDDADRKEVRT